MKNFSEGLKYAMAQADMSQSALSEKSGCSKAAISQYLSGKNTPGPAKVSCSLETPKICVFGMTPPRKLNPSYPPFPATGASITPPTLKAMMLTGWIAPFTFCGWGRANEPISPPTESP